MSKPQASSAFQLQRQLIFAAFQIGQTYTYRRTFSDGDLTLFCGLTGDLNPFHLDDTFSAQGPFGRRILPGLLPASMVTHIGGLLGFLATEMNFEFLVPIYVGDTVTCTVRLESKDETRRRMGCSAEFVNQSGESVIRATFSGFPTQPRLHPDPPLPQP